MAETTDAAGTYETKAEAFESSSSFVKLWLDALDRADTEEDDWRKEAETTTEIYRGKKKTKGRRQFNMLHSNVETLCPALYNSTPIPDVRRRFSDPDVIAKTVSDLIERSLSFSVDAYDFDVVMKAVIKDGEIVGRGVPRVRYVPTFSPVAQPMPGGPTEEVVYEEVTCSYVPWRYFRRGPARTWDEVPWVAFGDFLTREDLRRLCKDQKGQPLRDKNGNLVADQVPLDHTSDTKDGARKGGKTRKAGTEEQTIFRRAFVWQIWDKDTRKVISVCPEYGDSVLAMVPDPLGLLEFFPVPRPYQPVVSTDSLTPVVPYEVYEDLVEELNECTTRINRLVKQMRVRGGYASTQASALKSIADADDGELVPLEGVEHLLANGGLEKNLVWWPIDMIVKALEILLKQRQEIKQIIYEVTGIADILRGSTDPNETLGAQQLKAQWGSLRIQNRQAEAARVARDLFRLKSEIMAKRFSWDTLSQMSGIVLPTQQEIQVAQQAIAAHQQATQQAQAMQAPPQPGMPPAPAAPPPPPLPPEVLEAVEGPAREDVEQILRSDVMRRYKIDIESDSTIRGDLARNQQVMVQFVQGTAQYAQAMGPLVQMNPGLMPAVIQLYAAFARQFKLGKQAEDELEKLIEKASQPPAPPQPPPLDPAIQAKAEAAKVGAEAKIATTQMTMQREGAKHGMEMEKLAAEQEANAVNHAMQREQSAMTATMGYGMPTQ